MAIINAKKEKFNDYEGFIEKFKPKKTTDDCYTPARVYRVVKDYVFDYYGLDKDVEVVRPFYPGGDYENYKYPENSIVIDNPPFSRLSEIKKFYCENKVRFFLFAPHLTLLSSIDYEISYVLTNVGIVYHNGARVNTSFVTNIDDCRLRLDSKLAKFIKGAQIDEKKKRARYRYPDNVISSALLSKYINMGCDIKFYDKDLYFIRRLDSQQKYKKTIYGSGFLISDEKVKELKEVAEDKNFFVWDLSEREKNIIRSLG